MLNINRLSLKWCNQSHCAQLQSCFEAKRDQTQCGCKASWMFDTSWELPHPKHFIGGVEWISFFCTEISTDNVDDCLIVSLIDELILPKTKFFI